MNRSTGRHHIVGVVNGVQREEEEQDSRTDTEEQELGTSETRVDIRDILDRIDLEIEE